MSETREVREIATEFICCQMGFDPSRCQDWVNDLTALIEADRKACAEQSHLVYDKERRTILTQGAKEIIAALTAELEKVKEERDTAKTAHLNAIGVINSGGVDYEARLQDIAALEEANRKLREEVERLTKLLER